MHPTVVIAHSDCRRHRPGLGHPESPDRLRAALDGVPPELEILTPPPAALDDLARVHDISYIESIRDRSAAGTVIHTDPDTVLSPGTWTAALHAVGAMRLAVETVMHARAQRAFCIVRPPGHHAEHAHTKGFCFFNTIAIGARILQQEYALQRIAIIDWDAHHGNGTQDTFYGESGVFYISLHQYPLFPGSGRHSQRGTGEGIGATLNIPLAVGSTDYDVCQAFDTEIAPAIGAYQPQIILISAGFDGHVAERLSALMLTETGYGEMTRRVGEWADRFCSGRIISLLEGGYHLPALTACTDAHLRALRGA